MDSNIAVELHPDHDYEPSPINDIGLSDEELVTKSTRDFNNYLKKKNIPEERKKENEPSPINTPNDIGLSVEELVMISTRELNNYLKEKNIPKERRKEIKHERRTLKNRGYAANCRKKKETCYDLLSSLNDKLRDEIECKQSQIKEAKRETEQLQHIKEYVEYECEQLEWEMEHGMVSELSSWGPLKLKSGEVAVTLASLPAKNLPWRPWSEYSKRKK